MKLKLLAAALGALATLGAQATTTDWGVHDTLEVSATLVSAGAFSDLILFSIPGASDITSTTVSNNLAGVLNITGGAVSLYQEAGAVDTLVGSYSFDGTTGSTGHSSLGLAAGSYYYEITGTATGSNGGFYSLTSTVSAVPEPGAVAMLLAGLGVVGLVYRRRTG
jgi:hypothetical protein